MNFQQWGCTVIERNRSYYHQDYTTTLEIVMRPFAAFTWYSSVIKFNWEASSYSIHEIDSTVAAYELVVEDGYRVKFPALTDLPTTGPEADNDSQLVGDDDPPQDLGPVEEEAPPVLADGDYVFKRVTGTYVADTLYHQLLLSRSTSVVPEYPFTWRNSSTPSPISGCAYGSMFQAYTPNGSGYMDFNGAAPSWSGSEERLLCLKPVDDGFLLVQPTTGLVLACDQQLGSVGNYGGGSCFDTMFTQESSTGTTAPRNFQAIPVSAE